MTVLHSHPLAMFAALVAGAAQAVSPFTVTARLDRATVPPLVVVEATVPSGHYLYADSWSVGVGKSLLAPRAALPSRRVVDSFTNEEREVFKESFVASYALPPGSAGWRVEVGWQGCSETICFMPESAVFELGEMAAPAAALEDVEPTPGGAGDWHAGMRVAATAAGYLAAGDFIALLDRAEGGAAPAAAARQGGGLRAFAVDPAAYLRDRGWSITILLMLLGGLLLNLTPCVLPMIPINLAIIGAGSRQRSRTRGFAMGGAYGLGMALAYGALGLVVVLTGSVFGALQSSPWFNLAIAAVFVVLALALFDLLAIDLTRFQRQGATAGGIAAAISMGAVSALLAGACVAPVVMAMLLLASQFYQAGAKVALLLPLALGVGMALPWPFAGAGLTFLPKPGRWMSWVKYAFAVVVLLLAVHYGRLAWRGFQDVAPSGDSIAAGDSAAWRQRLDQARGAGKPVLVDFWATWCKNCHAMERTTFRDPAVVSRLRDYELVKVQAERPEREPARSMLQALGVGGLPTYLVLRADSEE